MKVNLKEAIFLIIFSLVGSQSNAQDQIEKTTYKNELKVNIGLSLISIPSLSYEYVLNRKMSLGLGGAYNFNDFDSFRSMWLVTYRYYPFSSRDAVGFFAELNTGLIASEDDLVFEGAITNSGPIKNEDHLAFGAGLAIGYKLPLGKRWISEAFLGLGKEFNDDSSIEGYPSIGLTGGYRF
ncbi:MAG: DUF3575 domain-containing protein [Flavobacteriales bacterium]|nr:DUF3575 domain-containing protein [Flavobacteriales bacterium]